MDFFSFFRKKQTPPSGSVAKDRLKLVLVEQKRTGKWLAEQLGKDPSTVSKWCSNVTQPTLDTLVNIAKVLDVDIKDLINNK